MAVGMWVANAHGILHKGSKRMTQTDNARGQV